MPQKLFDQAIKGKPSVFALICPPKSRGIYAHDLFGEKAGAPRAKPNLNRALSERERESFVEATGPGYLALGRPHRNAVNLHGMRTISYKVNTGLQHHAPAMLRQHINFIDCSKSLSEIPAQLLTKIIAELGPDYLVNVHPAEFVAAVLAQSLAGWIDGRYLTACVESKYDRVVVRIKRSFNVCTEEIIFHCA